ncbi:MAG: ABC transporter substrate-binding protein [Chloroflexi bacterium]|nr:ABC transporter substrate-binding protein [Chloroflexota bacterium]
MPASKWLIVFALPLAMGWVGCVSTTPQVVKIGLVAPFEGEYRQLGYDIVPAVRLALRDYTANYADDLGLVVELVAYDDRCEADLAQEQARKLLVDDSVVGVIGHFCDQATAAALPLYVEYGLPVVTLHPQDTSSGLVTVWGRTVNESPLHIPAEWIGWNRGSFVSLGALPSDSGLSTDDVEHFNAGFAVGSLGAEPGLLSYAAYEMAWLAIQQAVQDSIGLSIETPIDDAFIEDGRRLEAPAYRYQWDGESLELIEVIP